MRTKLKKKTKNKRKLSGDKLQGRSRISNGSQLLPDVDGRSTYARRVRDLVKIHIEDLGGSNSISQAQLSLIRRASVLTAEIEFMESKFANANGATRFALERYQRTINTLRRLLESMGLHRKERPMRDVTPPTFNLGTDTDDIDTSEYEKTFGGDGMQFILIDDHKVFFVMNANTENETIKRMAHLEDDFNFIERLRGQQQGAL